MISLQFEKFLELSSAILGLISSFYFCRSNFMTTEDILQSTTAGSCCDYSGKQVEGMAKQKANALAGALLLLLAFLIQIFNISYKNDIAVSYTFIVVAIILIISFLEIFRKSYAKRIITDAEKISGSEMLKNYMTKSKIISSCHVPGIISTIEMRMHSKQLPNETAKQYIERFAKHCGYKLPSGWNIEEPKNKI